MYYICTTVKALIFRRSHIPTIVLFLEMPVYNSGCKTFENCVILDNNRLSID